MKSSPENFLAMAVATSKVCHQNAALTSLPPSVNAAVAEIDHRIAAIQAYALSQKQSAKNIALKKKNARNAAVTASLHVLTGIIILANEINDIDLLAKTELYKVKSNGCSDQSTVENLSLVLMLARTHAIALANYGVSASSIADLETRISIFDELSLEPRMQIAKLKNVVARINALTVGLADMFSYKLDGMIETLQESNSGFYDEYFRARIIVDLQTGVKGIAEDTLSRIRLRNVKITLLERRAKRNTSKHGKFAFKRLAPGKYTLKVEAPGYEELIVKDVKVNTGETTDLDLHLKKNAA